MIKKIQERLGKEETANLVILTHQDPDYDAFSSTIGLGNYLYEVCPNVDVYIVLDNTKFRKIELKNNLKLYSSEDVNDIDFDYAIVCDVNEKSRVHLNSLLEDVPINNRYLYDHHTGNINELDILLENSFIDGNAAATTEIIIRDFISDKVNIGSDLAFNLYTGIVSDTCCFVRDVNSFTKCIRDDNLLGLDDEKKEMIEQAFSNLSEEDKMRVSKIKLDLENSSDDIKIFRLVDDSLMDKITSFMNGTIEEKIKASDNGIAIFVIECCGEIHLKFRKGKHSQYDIVELAKDFNGGGHEFRTAAKCGKTSYEEVISKIKDLTKSYVFKR
jgi:nanoRNase/pAp phosphatase (c-di-AMP/oligoRNAs hydrolase)